MDYHLDGKNKSLGRLASEIAIILQGKKSPSYEPRLRGEDRVILENFDQIIVTGRKPSQKLYHRHTGYVGGIKTETFKQAFSKDPKRVIREAVRRMLPKNSLNPKRLKNLVFVEK